MGSSRRRLWFCRGSVLSHAAPVVALGALMVLPAAGTGCTVSSDAGGGGAEAASPPISPRAIDKVDLLIVIDDSPSMLDKLDAVALGVGDLVERLLVPYCVEGPELHVVGRADDFGNCARGGLEFPPMRDLHVGFISGSLGFGGHPLACASPAGNRRAHLSLGAGDALGSSAPMLHWKPTHAASLPRSRPAALRQELPHDEFNPPAAVLPDSADRFADRVTNVIRTWPAPGCGFEATLEAAYRFLVDPAPYDHIELGDDAPPDIPRRARPVGVDDALLAQRRAFLRPDSLLAAIIVTDENDASLDPLALRGRAWTVWDQPNWGSHACASDPNAPDCMSCLLPESYGLPGCDSTIWPDHVHGDNLTFFDPKRRYGFEPRFPIDRYVRGFGTPTIEVRSDAASGAFAGFHTDFVVECDNPLFAGALPRNGSESSCILEPGVRRPEDIVFGVIAGVPWQLLTDRPQSDVETGAPLKSALSEEDWTRIVGRDPARYDATGADPRMVESAAPRPGRPTGPPELPFRDYDTRFRGEYMYLQTACSFELPTSLDCSTPEGEYVPDSRCYCGESRTPADAPYCAGADRLTQTQFFATPGVRELAVARGLGPRASVMSICPRFLDQASRTDASGAPNPEWGYRPVMRAIVSRLTASSRPADPPCPD